MALPTTTTRAATVRVIDLFAGIGGFHLAFQQAGGRVVYAVERDAAARRTYEANYASRSPELFTADRFASDVRAVDPFDLPDYDVLTAGFPCQSFSVGGVGRGLRDERGLLFFEIVRLLRATRPQAFFLENVCGLLSNDGGRTFRTVMRLLADDLGYVVHHRVVWASEFGLPQLRPRVFIVGLRDFRAPFRFPEPVPLRLTMDDIFGGRCHRRIGNTVLASHRGKPFGLKRAWDSYLVDGKLRRVGVREARIMQGFPDDFVFPVSDNRAMQQLGNAVAVAPAAAVAKALVASISPSRMKLRTAHSYSKLPRAELAAR